MKGMSRYQLRYAAGVYWLLDMEQAGGEYTRPVVMNECGAYIWQNCEKSIPEDRIAEMLHIQYGISVKEAFADIRLFIEQMREHGVIM